MDENIRLELFSVSEVRNWLYHGLSERGLSEKLIAKQRAYAIVNNPYVNDDLYIISALFVNDEVAAYTYIFPDKVYFYTYSEKNEAQLIYWNTTLYCNPNYEGRGYAYCVIGQFVELYGDNYFDLDAVEESVENLRFAGLTVEYVNQYMLSKKTINTHTFRGKLAFMIAGIKDVVTNRKKQLLLDINNSCYILQYTDYIDDETYEFIRKYSKMDLFLRTPDMFNWILRYPFMLGNPLLHRVKKDTEFTSNRQSFQFHAVRVIKDDELIGFYIFNDSKDCFYLNYLYYNEKFQREVFLSIAEHILYCNKAKFMTANSSLASFLEKYRLFPKSLIINKSFSYPQRFIYDKKAFIQAGDGDNIT